MTWTLGERNDLDLVDREHIVRIAREAIVNAALHGRARRVEVVLSRNGGDIVMRITDDGWGITDAHGSGMGLRTMRARAAALGGHLSARIPVPPAGPSSSSPFPDPFRRASHPGAAGDASPTRAAATARAPDVG